MTIEHFSEKERKIKEFNESEEKEKIKKRLAFEKEKKEVLHKLESAQNLSYLKSLIDRWLISINVAKTVIEWWNFDNIQIEEIFEKIDEIENIKKIDRYLPKELRLTKEEYLGALENKDLRQQSIGKLNDALDYIYHSTHPFNSSFINLSYIIVLLNQNLSKIHTNSIDIKRSLEWIDREQNEKWLWKQTLDFFRDIF